MRLIKLAIFSLLFFSHYSFSHGDTNFFGSLCLNDPALPSGCQSLISQCSVRNAGCHTHETGTIGRFRVVYVQSCQLPQVPNPDGENCIHPEDIEPSPLSCSLPALDAPSGCKPEHCSSGQFFTSGLGIGNPSCQDLGNSNPDNPCLVGQYGAVVDGIPSCFNEGDPDIPDWADLIDEGDLEPLPEQPEPDPPQDDDSTPDPNNNDNNNSDSGNDNTPDNGNGTGTDTGNNNGDSQDNNGNGDSSGSGSERIGVITGGESCESSPVRGSDTTDFEWQTVLQNYRIRCPLTSLADTQLDDEFSSYADDELEALQQEYEQTITDIRTQMANALSLSVSGSGSIQSNNKTIMGQTVDFSWSRFAGDLSIIGAVIIAMAYLFSAFVIFRR